MTDTSGSSNSGTPEPRRPRFDASPILTFEPGERARVTAFRADVRSGWPEGTHVVTIDDGRGGQGLTMYGPYADLEATLVELLEALRAVPEPEPVSEAGQ